MIHECVDQYACSAANINFNVEGLRSGFWQLTIDGLVVGGHLRAGGRRLHAGVRRAAADQLRALRDLHARHVRRLLRARHASWASRRAAMPTTRAFALTMLYLGIAMLFAMLVSGAAAVGLEFVAYRPLRRRNARSLTFLITAIGMSFVLQEFVHFVLPQAASRATAAATRSSRSSWCSPRRSSPSSAPRSPTSRS